jgi:hypothetical protein
MPKRQEEMGEVKGAWRPELPLSVACTRRRAGKAGTRARDRSLVVVRSRKQDVKEASLGGRILRMLGSCSLRAAEA